MPEMVPAFARTISGREVASNEIKPPNSTDNRIT